MERAPSEMPPNQYPLYQPVPNSGPVSSHNLIDAPEFEATLRAAFFYKVSLCAQQGNIKFLENYFKADI
jgi:hypothetical protein